MRSLLIKIWNTIKITSLKSKEDPKWIAYEQERKDKLKKEHRFIYLFEKIETPLMIIGLTAYLVDILVLKVFGPSIYILTRILSGIAMSLGFVSWLRITMERKRTFYWMIKSRKLLDMMHEALSKVVIGKSSSVPEKKKLPN